MIELYQLEHLLAIAAHGTMTKAAEELHLSQSALSRSIQRQWNTPEKCWLRWMSWWLTSGPLTEADTPSP